MPWPTPQDYNEAIQNPQTAFIDSELRAGKPELNALQLPRAITGQFASVYKMKCGARTWAVRCFLRNVPNQQQRYEAISAHLRTVKLPLPYVVDFEYQPQGIRVRGQSYPILKMAWVNGASLTSYIESHLASPGLLGNLAYRWLEMTRALRRAGVSHGDLQHGNVLVHNSGTNNALMLVDYDGMFVPALAGQLSYETGHRNFQHPQRNESHFDAEVDNFSAWVIYLSLYALRTEPKLWQKFAGGDECLLFRRRDFEQPEQSALLRALAESSDDHLRASAAAFKAMLVNRVAVEAIPNLDLQSRVSATSTPSWLADHVSVATASNGAAATAVPEAKVTAVAETAATPQVANRDEVLARLKSLLSIFVEPSPPPQTAPATQSPTASSSSTPLPAPIFFEHNPLAERLVAYASLGVSLALAASMVMNAIPLAMGGVGVGLIALANVIAWVQHYRRDTATIAREQVNADIFLREREEHKLKQTAKKLAREREKAQRKHAKPAQDLERQHVRIKAEEQAEIDKLERQTQARIAALNAQQQTALQKESDAVRKSSAAAGAQMAELQRQIAGLVQAEADELERRLRGRQEQYVLMALYKFAIEDLQLPGLTKQLKTRLQAAGIVTAADIDQHAAAMIEIAPDQVAALTDWRTYLDTQARVAAPNTLQPAEANVVRSAYARRRQHLEGEVQRWRTRVQAEAATFHNLSRTQQEALNKKIADAQARRSQEEEQIRKRFTQRYVQLGTDVSRVMQRISPQVQVATARLDEAQRKLAASQFDREQLVARMQDEYRAINFWTYVRWIFLGRNGLG